MSKEIQKYQESQQLAQPIEIRLADAPGAAPAPAGSKEAKKAEKKAAKEAKRPFKARAYAITSLIMGIAALVSLVILGVFSLATALPYGIGLVAAIIGIVCGALAKKNGDTSGMGTAGLVMSIIGPALLVAVVLLFVVGCAGCVGCMGLLSSAPVAAIIL